MYILCVTNIVFVYQCIIPFWDITEENQMVDSLAIVASDFKVPLDFKETYDVQIKNRPFNPDNIKYW